MFISFAGVNGSGKTTQSRLLWEYLKECGKRAAVTKALDDQQRQLAALFTRWSRRLPSGGFLENILLFSAFYKAQVEEVRMLREKDYVVIADRFLESFILFHRMYGLLYKREFEFYGILKKAIFGDTRPDITFYLKVDREEANVRITRRNPTDKENETEWTYQESTAILDELSRGDSWVEIDGQKTETEVHNQIIAALYL